MISGNQLTQLMKTALRMRAFKITFSNCSFSQDAAAAWLDLLNSGGGMTIEIIAGDKTEIIVDCPGGQQMRFANVDLAQM